MYLLKTGVVSMLYPHKSSLKQVPAIWDFYSMTPFETALLPQIALRYSLVFPSQGLYIFVTPLRLSAMELVEELWSISPPRGSDKSQAI